MSFEERLNEANRLKCIGDEAFNRGDYELAQSVYSEAIEKGDFNITNLDIEFSLEHQSLIQDLYNPIYLHLCKCALKTARFNEVLRYIDRIHEQCDYLAVDLWAQIEYIRGCSLIKLGRHRDALGCFTKAKDYRPFDPSIEKHIHTCKKTLQLIESRLNSRQSSSQENPSYSNRDRRNMYSYIMYGLIVAFGSFVLIRFYQSKAYHVYKIDS